MPFVAINLWCLIYTINGETGLAQLVEHWSPKPGVGGSSPSIRANIKQMKFIQYIKDSFEELNNHMTWSSSKDAQKTTVTVAIFTIVFALAVAGVDYVFQSGFSECLNPINDD